MFSFRSITCMLRTEGPSRSLWKSPRVRERAVNVLLESISLVPHCVQPDCQRLPLFIPTARLPAFATLYPNSQTARVCHSPSQQPDCQRLPLFIPTARLPTFVLSIPTARLPAFATLYPNSQTASVCHSLSQQPCRL